MTERIIPIADARYQAVIPLVPADAAPANGLAVDRRGRPLHDLRVSVTDRCNFRCTYCMPKEVFGRDYAFLPQSSLLSFEEIERVVRGFIAHGVEKVRLTGGEPLLRRNVESLVERLARLRTAGGEPLDLTLTTNGSLLARKARALRDAGLRRVTVSLDALDDRIFREMNDADFPVADVLAGIEAADAAGLRPLKINMVVRRGVNDHEIASMAAHFRGTGHILRFIEFMDVGASNAWQLQDVVPSAEVVQRLHEAFPLEPIDRNYEGEVAERWRYLDGEGEIGVISSVTQPFCGNCTRARLSTEGRVYTCLFAHSGHDLRALLRGGADDRTLEAAIGAVWRARDDRYSESRSSQTAGLRKIEMSYIGG
ncbi:MAG: GTP 3',8-cyclase MoaA [Gammaproteobacteria bacterium]